jgi:hypothetical protein
MAGDGIQTHHALVPKVKRVPASARSIIQEYLNMVDWRHILTGGPQGGTEDWYTCDTGTGGGGDGEKPHI